MVFQSQDVRNQDRGIGDPTAHVIDDSKRFCFNHHIQIMVINGKNFLKSKQFLNSLFKSDHHLPTGQHGQDVRYHVVFSKKMEHTKEVFKHDNVFQLFKNSVQMVFMNQNIKQMMLKLRQENVITLNVTLLTGDNGKNGANVARFVTVNSPVMIFQNLFRTKRKIQKNGKNVAVHACTRVVRYPNGRMRA